MKKNVLKAMMALCLCGLMLANVNVLLADDDFMVDPHDNGSCSSPTCEFCGGNGTGGGLGLTGTPQKNKSEGAAVEEITYYGKIDASGSWVVLEIGAEGSVTRKKTLSYTCCMTGGNNCSTNYRDCE